LNDKLFVIIQMLKHVDQLNGPKNIYL